MNHTYDVAHERDLNQFVRQHFTHIAERVRLTLFEAEGSIVPRNEPLAAVVALEAVILHAIAIGNHPHLVIAVASKACGIPLVRSGAGAMIREETPESAFLERTKREAGATPETATLAPQPLPESVTDAKGHKIRVVRAGDVAASVMQVLSRSAALDEAMTALDESETIALYEQLTQEIAKLIMQGVQ